MLFCVKLLRASYQTRCWTSYWTVMLSSPAAVSTPSDVSVEVEALSELYFAIFAAKVVLLDT